ncbi:choline transporter [Klebsiella aerogenes]|nr:choline transporter [Klebsiella aerogenes]KLF04163.1 choline transporter [Klebsiella aerogenes]RSV64945.1 choline transporter [Klebsiella aerogenes]RSV65813.1 choline transporter [Klebsiella aerogenes]RSV72189.1 choline transporter [Klebsiella aerogenes]
MKKQITWFFMLLELSLGIALIVYGLVKYFSQPAISEICTDASLCATDTMSFFTLWLYLTLGVMLICFWYVTTWRPYQFKMKRMDSTLKPEDLVK